MKTKKLKEMLKEHLSITIDKDTNCPIIGVTHKNLVVQLLFDNEVISEDKVTLKTKAI